MTTLKGVFGNPKPKYRRNFIQENVRQLREMQDYWHNREQINSVTGKIKAYKFQNVSSRIPPRFIGSQSKGSEQNAKEANKMEGLREITSSKTLGGSRSSPIGHVTQVGLTKKSHMREKSTAFKENNHKNMIRSGDMAECVNGQHANMKEVPSSNELSLDVSELSVSRERKPSMSVDSRSMGCQTIDPRNFEKLYTEGVIKYPSSRKLPNTKSRQSGKKPPTRDVGLQTDRVSSPDSNTARTDNTAAGDTSFSNDSNDPDFQKLSLSKLKVPGSEVDEIPDTGCAKVNSRSLRTKQKSSAHTSSDPLKAPPTYQKGVVPRYLRERREEWEKETEERGRNAHDPSCPPGHVPLPDSERKETLRMLRKSYADLVQELNMMPVRTDTLRMRHRKMELEKQLNKIEEGIKVFSRPKVFVKIGA